MTPTRSIINLSHEAQGDVTLVVTVRPVPDTDMRVFEYEPEILPGAPTIVEVETEGVELTLLQRPMLWCAEQREGRLMFRATLEATRDELVRIFGSKFDPSQIPTVPVLPLTIETDVTGRPREEQVDLGFGSVTAVAWKAGILVERPGDSQQRLQNPIKNITSCLKVIHAALLPRAKATLERNGMLNSIVVAVKDIDVPGVERHHPRFAGPTQHTVYTMLSRYLRRTGCIGALHVAAVPLIEISGEMVGEALVVQLLVAGSGQTECYVYPFSRKAHEIVWHGPVHKSLNHEENPLFAEYVGRDKNTSKWSPGLH